MRTPAKKAAARIKVWTGVTKQPQKTRDGSCWLGQATFYWKVDVLKKRHSQNIILSGPAKLVADGQHLVIQPKGVDEEYVYVDDRAEKDAKKDFLSAAMRKQTPKESKKAAKQAQKAEPQPDLTDEELAELDVEGFTDEEIAYMAAAAVVEAPAPDVDKLGYLKECIKFDPADTTVIPSFMLEDGYHVDILQKGPILVTNIKVEHGGGYGLVKVTAEIDAEGDVSSSYSPNATGSHRAIVYVGPSMDMCRDLGPRHRETLLNFRLPDDWSIVSTDARNNQLRLIFEQKTEKKGRRLASHVMTPSPR